MNRRTLAAAALIAVAVMAKHASASSHGSGSGHRGSVAANASEHGTLDCSQLEALWEAAGGSQSAAFMAASIAMAESAGEEYSTDNDSDGTTDEGYWQINTSHGSLATYDPAGNARAAVIISDNGTDWHPWVTYQHRAYEGKC